MTRITTLSILLGFIMLMNSPAQVFSSQEAADMPSTPAVVDKASTHNDQGILLFNRGDYGSALLEFNRALAENPSSTTILINRGVAFAARGQYKEAIENFHYALDYDKDNVMALTYLAGAYLHADNADRALQTYNRLKVLKPSDYRMYVRSGASYAILEQYNDAINDFSQAIYLKADYQPAFIGRGISYTATGRFEWALSDLERAMHTSHNDAFLYLIRSMDNAGLGSFDKALADLNKSCSLGYSQVCDAVKRSKEEIETAGTSFSVKYATKTRSEEIYTKARGLLDSFLAKKQKSELQKLSGYALRPLHIGGWSHLLTDADKTSWSIQPSGLSSHTDGTITVIARFHPEANSALHLRMQEILKSAGRPYESYMYSEDTFEINCKAGKIRAISSREVGTDGETLNAESNTSRWFEIAPGSAADVMRRNSCPQF